MVRCAQIVSLYPFFQLFDVRENRAIQATKMVNREAVRDMPSLNGAATVAQVSCNSLPGIQPLLRK